MTCQLEPLVPVDLFADPWRWKCVHCGAEYGTHDAVKTCTLSGQAVIRKHVEAATTPPDKKWFSLSIDDATPAEWDAANREMR